MDVTLTSRATQFFTAKENSEPTEKLYTCKLCNKPINGKQKSNLSVHLKTCHTELYNTKVKLPDKGSLIAVREKRLVLLQNCVRKVTIDHEPFSAISKSSFQNIIANKLKKFALANVPLNLRDKNLTVVKGHLHTTAAKIRMKIKTELKGRLFSLMVDGASRNNRSVLGISAQFIINGKLKIRMLGLRELTESHTGDYLGAVVRECIEDYDCKISQSISCTTDNAANMTKMVRDMNKENNDEEEQVNTVHPSTELISIENFDENCEQPLDFQINELLEILEEMEAEEINAILSDSLNDDDDGVIQINPRDISVPAIFVNHVNCASHTIQLVVSDALKELSPTHNNIIKMCREFSKFIRRQANITKLKNMGIKWKYPKIDCVTRWGSTWFMVSPPTTNEHSIIRIW